MSTHRHSPGAGLLQAVVLQADQKRFLVSEEVQLEIDLLASDADTSAPKSKPQQPSIPANQEALTILIADDDRDMRLYLRRCLKDLQSRVGTIIEAEDGLEALDRIQQGDVHLVISDLVMPRMDGLALCRALGQDEDLHHLPVLLITGDASARDIQRELGLSEERTVLVKPFNAKKLCARVRDLLRHASID